MPVVPAVLCCGGRNSRLVFVPTLVRKTKWMRWVGLMKMMVRNYSMQGMQLGRVLLCKPRWAVKDVLFIVLVNNEPRPRLYNPTVGYKFDIMVDGILMSVQTPEQNKLNILSLDHPPFSCS